MARFTSFLLALTGLLQSASSAAVDTTQDLVPASKSLSARQNIESNTPLLKYFISPKGQIPRCPNDAEQVPYTKKDYYYKCEKDGHFAEGFSRVNIKHWCCFNPVQEIFFFPEVHVNFLDGQTVTPDANIMIDGADCCRDTISEVDATWNEISGSCSYEKYHTVIQQGKDMITKCCFDTKAKAFNIHLKDNKPYSSLSGDSLKAFGVPIPYTMEDFSYHAHDNVNVSFARAEATVNDIYFYGSRLEVDMSATIDNFQIKAYYEHLSKLISDEPELKFEHKRLVFHFRRKWTEVGSFRIPTTLNLYGPLYIDLYSKVVTTERDGQTDYTFHISGHVRGTGLTGRLDESQGRLVPVIDWLNGTLADAAVC